MKVFKLLLSCLILIFFFTCSRNPETDDISTSNSYTTTEDQNPPAIDSIIFPTNNSTIYVFDDLMFNISGSDDNNIKNLYIIIDNYTNIIPINQRIFNKKGYIKIKNEIAGNSKEIKFILEDDSSKKSNIKSITINIVPSEIDWDYKESFNDFLPNEIKVNYRDGIIENSLYNTKWTYTAVRNDGGSNLNNISPYYENPLSLTNTPLLPTPVIRNSNIAILISNPIQGGISKLYFQYYQPFSTSLNFKLIITEENTNNILFETNIQNSGDRYNLREFGPIDLNINKTFRIILSQNGGGQLAIDNIRWKKDDGQSSSSSTTSTSSSSSQSSTSSSSSSTSSSSSSVNSIIFLEDFSSFNSNNISYTYITNGKITNISYGVIWNIIQVRNDGGTTGSGSTNYTNINQIPNPPILPTPVIRNTNISILLSSEINILESGTYSIYFQYYQPFSSGLNFKFQVTTSQTDTILYETNIAITNRAVLYEFGPLPLLLTNSQIRLLFKQNANGGQLAIDNLILRKE